MSSSAVGKRSCGAEDGLQTYLATDEEFRETYDELNRFAAEHDRLVEADEIEARPSLVTIPVVVHVVYRNESENVSNGQIRSQLRVLNRDFTAKNADLDDVPETFESVIGKPGIRFKLAKRDPHGAATNGIVRTQTTVSSFTYDPSASTGPARNPVKFASAGGSDAWPSDQYLNVWVCPQIQTTGGDAILGYASFPGMPPREDGVVVGHRYFGTIGTATAPFDRGRTATHEIGHWLNLRHIWGDDGSACTGTDHVADTPNQAGPNFDQPTHPKPSCGNDGDMFMNYMDYVDDVAMFMFSAGQAERMDATLDGARAKILESKALKPPKSRSADESITPA